MKNYFGQTVTGTEKFQDETFGYYDENGKKHVNWKEEDKTVDSDGFDKTNVEKNGNYKETVSLPQGKLLARYGNLRGRLTTDVEANYDDLALPYVKESVEYHVFKVMADGSTMECTVEQGRVAPMFNSKGGAPQYKHPQSLERELAEGKITEVEIHEEE